MRRVRGVTLESVLDDLRTGTPAATKEHTRHKLLAAFVRVCLAIQFAGEHGVLHRDLKPANIMLGKHGEVYVLDWGLAKVRGSTDSIEPRATSDEPPSSRRGISGVSGSNTEVGSILGTPQYMSPEQILGEELDTRSDVYALGAILFEILTLQPLHGSGTVAEILRRAVAGADARASVRAPGSDVPPELEAACVLATARAPSERLENARALADLVEAYMSGDRDLALRRELAEVHLSRARESIARSTMPGASPTESAEALRETGRAIALAPDDPEALGLLVALLTKPPESVPAEVEEEVLRQETEARHRLAPRIAGLFIGVAFTAVAFQWTMGIRSHLWILLPPAFWLAAGLLALLMPKTDPKGKSSLPLLTLAASIGLATSTTHWGPFVVVPSFAAALGMGTAMQANRPLLNRALALVALAMLIPSVLAWAGLHPVEHVFRENTLTIVSPAVNMPGNAMMGFFTVMTLIGVVLPTQYAMAHRAQLLKSKTRIELQAWQLRKLVPDAAAAAMNRPITPPRRPQKPG
jgi:serine/threonine-protein kinase